MMHIRVPAMAALALAIVSPSSPAAAAVPADGDPVLWWNEVYLNSLPFPTGFQRNSASFNIAMHDAINAAVGKPHYGYLNLPVSAGGDVRAAAAKAAYDTLIVRAPGQAAIWDSALATQLALVPDGPAKDKGLATGAAYAAAILAARASDGTGAPTPYTPSGLPGRWAPTPPGFLPAVNPWLGNVTPWLTTGNDQFRPGPPPSLDSAAYAAAFEEVRTLGSLDSAARSADQTDAATFWAAATGAVIFLRAGIEMAAPLGWDAIDNAALFARLHVALADVTQSTQNSIYFYDYWRPVTAIHAADTDGNPATVADPAWTPFSVAPAFPSYASLTSSIGGAMAAILEAELGALPFCSTAAGLTRCFDSAGHAVAEAGEARIWGGVQWRFDGEAGLALGHDIAAWTLAAKPFGAVPEPGNWALLVAGFGLMGAALRRRASFSARSLA